MLIESQFFSRKLEMNRFCFTKVLTKLHNAIIVAVWFPTFKYLTSFWTCQKSWGKSDWAKIAFASKCNSSSEEFSLEEESSITKFTLDLENKQCFIIRKLTFLTANSFFAVLSLWKLKYRARSHELMSLLSIVHINNVALWVSKKTGITQKYSNSNLTIILLLTDFLQSYFGDGYKVILTLPSQLKTFSSLFLFFVERDVWNYPMNLANPNLDNFSEASRHMGWFTFVI